MSKPIKQRFYIDIDYITKDVPKKELQRIIKSAVQAELLDLARDFNTKIIATKVTVVPEPVAVRAQRQAQENAKARNKQWYATT